MPRSRANCTAWTLPSMPRGPNPPGTTTPETLRSSRSISSPVAVSELIQTTSTSTSCCKSGVHQRFGDADVGIVQLDILADKPDADRLLVPLDVLDHRPPSRGDPGSAAGRSGWRRTRRGRPPRGSAALRRWWRRWACRSRPPAPTSQKSAIFSRTSSGMS